jgi:3-phosphoshikimate 1-carboxyvinyltransferase
VIDELPLLAVLATRAEGVSEVTGAAELRVKESDRIATITAGLRRLGAQVEELPDGFRIAGPQPLRPEADTVIVTEGDHRIAMAFAVAALAAEGEFAIDDAACMAVSYPGFLETLAAMQRGG